MEVKLLEVHDRATCIPIMAIRASAANEAQRALLARAGFGRTEEDGRRYVVMTLLSGLISANYDPAHWTNRTLYEAHEYILRHFDELSDGDVVDVEFILGETTEPSPAEWR